MFTKGKPTAPEPSPFDSIVPGARVTIRTPQGQEVTGKAATALLSGPDHWVLNMGGPHGQPAVATRANVVKVKLPKGASKASERARKGLADFLGDS